MKDIVSLLVAAVLGGGILKLLTDIKFELGSISVTITNYGARLTTIEEKIQHEESLRKQTYSCGPNCISRDAQSLS